MDETADRIEKEVEPSEHVKHWVNFCRNSKRGLIGFQGTVVEPQEDFSEFEELLAEV